MELLYSGSVILTHRIEVHGQNNAQVNRTSLYN